MTSSEKRERIIQEATEICRRKVKALSLGQITERGLGPGALLPEISDGLKFWESEGEEDG